PHGDMFFYFFFSSRRRHTRSKRDWSSDVCSSDLIIDMQKLGQSWDKVRKNKPASGVDHVTYEDFQKNRREELKQLHLELAEHRYESLPVKLCKIFKEDKVRTIALFSMRDKIVQQSVVQ